MEVLNDFFAAPKKRTQGKTPWVQHKYSLRGVPRKR